MAGVEGQEVAFDCVVDGWIGEVGEDKDQTFVWIGHDRLASTTWLFPFPFVPSGRLNRSIQVFPGNTTFDHTHNKTAPLHALMNR